MRLHGKREKTRDREAQLAISIYIPSSPGTKQMSGKILLNIPVPAMMIWKTGIQMAAITKHNLVQPSQS